MPQSGLVRAARPRWHASLLLVTGLFAFAAGAEANVIKVAASAVNAGGSTCSLIDAITAANSNAKTGACPAGDDKTNGGDVIVLSAGVYKIGTADDDWYGPNGLPPITSKITIVGDPKGSIIMRSANVGVSAFRIFYVGGGESLTPYNPPQDGNSNVVFTALPGPGKLTLINLTLENGLAQGGAGGSSSLGGGGGGLGAGGAIYNQGTLSLQGVTLVGNQAIGGAGGGSSSTASADPGGGGGMAGAGDSFGNGGGFNTNGPWPDTTTPPGEFGNGGGPNQAGGVGGGGGSSKNGGFGGGGGGINGFGGFGGGGGGVSPGGFGGGFFFGGGAGMGGAIFNEGGTVTVQDCTFTANDAEGGAGGIAGLGQAEGLGAAIFNLNGNLTISYSTLAGNNLSGSTVSGGAVYNLQLATPGSPAADASASASLDLDSSILYGSLQLTTDSSGNVTSSAATDCANDGGGLSGGHDVLGPTSASCILGSDLFTTPALLPLANNGGPTPTMAIIIGSALNTGNTTTAPLLDQRGYLRDVLPDVGAYELSNTPIAIPVVNGLQNASAVAGGSVSQQAFNLSGNTVSQPHLTVAVVSSDSSILPAANLALSSNCGASLALDACTLNVTPTAKGVGTAVVTLSATNGYGQTGYGSFTQTIIPPAPVAKSDTLTVASGQTLNGSLTATQALNATLTYAIVTQTTHGTLKLNSASGSAFTYTPKDGFIGSDSFTWKANNGSDSNIATDSITVTLPTPPPGAPTVSDLSFDVKENVAFSGTLTATGSSSTSFAIGTAPTHGKVKITDATSGAFTYTPAAGFTGSDSFTYTATDTLLKATSNPATVSLSVSITGTGGSSSGGGGSSSGGSSSGGSGSGGGSSSGGSSGGGGANSVAPIASAQSLTTYAGTPVKGTLTASDAGGNALVFAVTQPTHGTVSVSDPATGAFSYSPAAGYTGADSFSFTATDSVSKLVSSAAVVSLTVTAIPVSSTAVPLVGNAAFTTYENVTVTGQLSASDAAGNALNYLRVTPPAHGIVTVTPATGAFSYTPTTGYVGNDSFTFSASDAVTRVSSTTATISLAMVALPPAAPAKPVANAAAYAAYEDVPVKAAVTASEAAGDALTYAVSTAPSHGALSAIAADGTFTYTPTAAYIGPDSFSFTASDATTSLVSDPATITLTVSALPPPGPVAANLSVATYEGVTVAGVLPASDGNGNPITYASTLPTQGILTLTAGTGAFTYAPNASYVGPDSFTFTVTDTVTGAVSANATVTLSVDPVPGPVTTAAPLADNSSVTVYENQSLTARVSAASAGGNTLTYAVVTQPAHGVLSLTTGSGAYTYTPTATYTGADSFIYTATDNGTSVISANATVSITVAAAPPPATSPQVDDASFTLYQDQPLSGTLAAADAAGNPVNFSMVQPSHGSVTLTATSGAFTYTPAAGFTGSDSFTFTAIDTSTNAASNAATVTLTVSATPIAGVAPLSSGASVSVYQGQVLKGQFAAVTTGGDALSYALKTKPAHGSVKVAAATGAYSYSPTAGYAGKDSFSFVATDKVSHLMSSAASVAVTVISPPLQAVAPLANGLAVSVYSGQPINSAVSAVDVNGNPVAYAITTKPKSGSLSLDAGSGGFTYTPAAGFTGSDSFAYTATDTVSKLASTAAQVEITVVPAPPAPTHHGGPSLTGKGSYGGLSLMLLALLSLWRWRLHTGRRHRIVFAAFAVALLPTAVLSDDAPTPVVNAPITDAWYVGGDANLIRPDSKRDASGGGLKGWGLLVGRDLGDFALEFDGEYHADAPRALDDIANWKTYGADGLWYFEQHKSDTFSPFMEGGAGLADQYRGDDSKVRSAYLKFGAGINSAPWRSVPVRFRADLAVQHVFSGYNDLLLSLGIEFTFGGTVPPPAPPAMPEASPLEQYPMAWCTAQGGTPYETANGWVCEQQAKPVKPACPPAASTAAAPAAASGAAPVTACPPQNAPPT